MSAGAIQTSVPDFPANSSKEFIEGLNKLLVVNSQQVTALLHVVTDIDTSTRDTAHGLAKHPPVR